MPELLFNQCWSQIENKKISIVWTKQQTPFEAVLHGLHKKSTFTHAAGILNYVIFTSETEN